MAEPSARELKLIQYLNEAYGKERQLEATLQLQIRLADKTLKKRLQDHLKETKQQTRNLERRIKQLGGKADAGPDLPGPDIVSDAAGAATSVANKALAAAKGPVSALRGTSRADNLLRNVRDAFWSEAEEIAHYNVIEAAATNLGDKETAMLAREHRKQEERMQAFLGKQIDQLVKAVIREEIPARERKPAGAAASRSRTSSRAKPSGSSSRAKVVSGASRSTKTSGSSSRTATSARSSTRAKAPRSSSRKKARSGSSQRKSSGLATRTKPAGVAARSSSRRSPSRSARAHQARPADLHDLMDRPAVASVGDLSPEDRARALAIFAERERRAASK